MSPNLDFSTVFVGAISVASFGGSFWSAALACVTGTGLGALAHATLSAWGPRFGVPQLVQSRAAFGFRGNVLPAFLASITSGIGWFAVQSAAAAFA